MPRRAGQSTATQFVRTLETAERDAEIARYCIGRKLKDVADHFEVAVSTVCHARQRAIADAVVPAGREVIAAELLKIDALEMAAWAVLRAHHLVVNEGRIMVDPRNSDLLADSKPVLMAIDRILKCQERRSKLLGLDAPARSEVTVLTTDTTEQAIAALEAQLAEHDAGSRSAPGAAPVSAGTSNRVRTPPARNGTHRVPDAR